MGGRPPRGPPTSTTMKLLALLHVLALVSALPSPGNDKGGNGHGNGNGNGRGANDGVVTHGCNGKGNPHCVGSTRPVVTPSPRQPRVPFPSPPPRKRECIVPVSGDDDSEAILSAMHACNNGGRVVFAKDSTYSIGTAMDWTFLQSIDIGELQR